MITGIFVLMSVVLYLIRFSLNVSTPHLNSSQVQILAMLVVFALADKYLFHMLKEEELKGWGYDYFGDKLIAVLSSMAFFIALVIFDKATFIYVMASFSVVIACLAYGHVRSAQATVIKREARAAKVSPYHAGILVKDMKRERLMEIVESMKSDNKVGTAILRVSSLGSNGYIISFPEGVSIDTFMDTVFELWDIDDASESVYEFGDRDVTGYYKFIEGENEGRMFMFTCGAEFEFNIVDEQGVSYDIHTPRLRFLRFFRREATRFVRAENKSVEFIPVDLKETISKGAVIKQVRIENLF